MRLRHCLTQEAIDQYQTDRCRLSFVLFDEIEKANDALWQLLLGHSRQGDAYARRQPQGRSVSLRDLHDVESRRRRDERNAVSGGIGFTSGVKTGRGESGADIDRKMYHTALDVAKRKFSPEFMNRIDKVVVFRTLNQQAFAAGSRYRIE